MIVPLPVWMDNVAPPVTADDDAIMDWVISLARRHVDEGTGGPFAAAIVREESREVVAVGVNLVQSLQCTMFHAEVVALMRAQHVVGTWDLQRMGTFVLYTSAEPCAMCMGAIPWAGIRRVVIAARDEDVRAIGFDEGVKAADWIDGYQQRGISVVRDVRRAQSVEVLERYHSSGGAIYNGGKWQQ
jgi:tRNA(Arg) A34 adenosine deaminase TadA